MRSSKSLLLTLLLVSGFPGQPARAEGDPAPQPNNDAFFAEANSDTAPAVLVPQPAWPTPNGRTIFLSHCAGCHGMAGDGRSAVADQLNSPPAAFTLALYKFRSTPSSKLPTDEDLFRTVSNGIPSTDMPAWGKILTPTERRAVIEYIKSLSPFFKELAPTPPIAIAQPPEATPESIEAGKALYKKMECFKCHGETGRGDGPSAATLKDQLGRRSNAYDFTGGRYHGGGAPNEVYRTFNTGMDGTPMPSYYASMTEEERWALVHFVKSLDAPRGALSGYFFPGAAGWEE